MLNVELAVDSRVVRIFVWHGYINSDSPLDDELGINLHSSCQNLLKLGLNSDSFRTTSVCNQFNFSFA